jgi:hypothetical protein
VPEPLVERPDVRAVLQRGRRERAPDGGAGRRPHDPRGPRCSLQGVLPYGFWEVVAPPLAGRSFEAGRRDLLPGTGLPFPRAFAVERARARDPSCAQGDVGEVLRLRSIEGRAQGRGRSPRPPRDPVLVSSPPAGRELPPAEVDVRLARPGARRPPRPSAGAPRSHPPVQAIPWADGRPDLVALQLTCGELRPLRPHARIAARPLEGAGVAVEGEPCGERRVLRRRAAVRLGREAMQDRGRALRADLRPVPPLGELATPPHPAGPGLRRPGAAVPPAGGGARPVGRVAAGRRRWRRGGHGRSIQPAVGPSNRTSDMTRPAHAL